MVGENVKIYNPYKSKIDTRFAKFLTIGNNAIITEGVVILCHDYSYAVVANEFYELLGKQKRTVIGNNVFIGINSIVLMGTNIGDNVIIGAGSVVSGTIESNSVYAGNPAKKICTLEEHHNRLMELFEESARVYSYNCKSVDEMGIYRSLFESEEEFREHIKQSHFNGISQDVLKNIKTDGFPRLNWDEFVNSKGGS